MWNGKESVAVDLMETEGVSIMAHDDKICYRAQKTGTGRSSGIGLTPDWWKKVEPSFKGGKPVIVGYFNPITKEHHGAEWCDTQEGEYKLSSERGWKVSTKKEYTEGFPPGVAVTFEANQVDIRIANLYSDLESRYKSTLQYFVRMAGEVIQYNPRSPETPRNKKEAMRNRLKRAFHPVEYEHNILFRGEVGRAIMRELRALAEHDKKMHLEKNTVYLEGWKNTRKKKKRVKFYDIGARDEKKGGRPGEVFKLEITFLRAYFDGEGLAVANLTKQPEIQEKIYPALAQSIEGVLRHLPEGGAAMEGITKELGIQKMVGNSYQVAGALLERKRTLTDRVQALENDMRELVRNDKETRRRLAALEQKRKG